MIRAVLDANIYISACLRPQGPPGRILRLLLKEQAFQLVGSTAIFDEVRRGLNYPRVRRYHAWSTEEIDRWVIALALVAEPTEGSLNLRVVKRDPDDDKYLVAAVEGRAGYLVSGDSDLLELQEYGGIRMVTAHAFIRIQEYGGIRMVTAHAFIRILEKTGT